MKRKGKKKSFKLTKIILAVVFILVLGVVSWFVYQTNNHNKGCGNPLEPSSPGSSVTLYCPASYSTVGKNFVITGHANPGFYKGTGVSLNVDGNYDYILPQVPFESLSKNGDFKIPVNLNGNRALGKEIIRTGDIYSSFPSGKHTFSITVVWGGCVAEPIQCGGTITSEKSATLTLYIK